MNILYGNRNANDPRFYLTSHYWIRCCFLSWIITIVHIVFASVAATDVIYQRIYGHYMFTFQGYFRLVLFITLTNFLCYGMFCKKSSYVKFAAHVYSSLGLLYLLLTGYLAAMALFPNPFARPFMTDDDFRRVVNMKDPNFSNQLFGQYAFFSSCLGLLSFLLYTIHMILIKYARQLTVLYQRDDAEAFPMG